MGVLYTGVSTILGAEKTNSVSRGLVCAYACAFSCIESVFITVVDSSVY